MPPSKKQPDARAELFELLRLLEPTNPKRKACKHLATAVGEGSLDLVKQFLAAGADVNQDWNGTPLATAAQLGRLDHLELLLKAGAKDIGGAVRKAARDGQVAALRRLMEEEVDLETDGVAALAEAAYHNRLEAVKILVERGVPIKANRYHAVGEAARHASMDVLKFFFSAGVKPENAGFALRMAAGSPLCFVAVKFLVEAGVDPVNHPDYSFNSVGDPLEKPCLPAEVAQEQNKSEVADFLRGKPIDVETLLAREEERRKKWDAMGDLSDLKELEEKEKAHLLRGEERIKGVRQAIELIRRPEMKSQIDTPGPGGETALGLAAQYGDMEIVAALLTAGADPNLGSSKLKTPPILDAAENGHTGVVEKLLKAGANPDAKDANGATPLVEAADWGDPEMVKLMLDAGADAKIKSDNSGFSPMTVEPGLQREAIRNLLREAVKKRSAGKPNKGQGLSFIKRNYDLDPATARGVEDFRKFYYDSSNPEWVVIFVQAPIDIVTKTFAALKKPKRCECDVAKKKVNFAREFVYLLQLKNSAWTIILRALGFYRIEIEKEAQELSKLLGARVYTYEAEDVSGGEGYELFDKGESVEKAIFCDGLKFESRLRSKPAFDEKKFPDPVFADEGIYLPLCYPDDDGFDIKLVVKGLPSGDVARADFMALND